MFSCLWLLKFIQTSVHAYIRTCIHQYMHPYIHACTVPCCSSLDALHVYGWHLKLIHTHTHTQVVGNPTFRNLCQHLPEHHVPGLRAGLRHAHSVLVQRRHVQRHQELQRLRFAGGGVHYHAEIRVLWRLCCLQFHCRQYKRDPTQIHIRRRSKHQPHPSSAYIFWFQRCVLDIINRSCNRTIRMFHGKHNSHRYARHHICC